MKLVLLGVLVATMLSSVPASAFTIHDVQQQIEPGSLKSWWNDMLYIFYGWDSKPSKWHNAATIAKLKPR